MRRRFWITAGIAGVGIAAAAYGVQRPEGEAPVAASEATGAPQRVVMVAPARVEICETVRRLPGIIAARTEADLGFRVAGKLLERRVEVGDTVRAGDIVATLDAI